FEIGEEVGIWPPVVARRRRQRTLDVARLHAREHVVAVDVVEVVGDPVDEAMPRLAEFIAVRIELRHGALIQSCPRTPAAARPASSAASTTYGCATARRAAWRSRRRCRRGAAGA